MLVNIWDLYTAQERQDGLPPTNHCSVKLGPLRLPFHQGTVPDSFEKAPPAGYQIISMYCHVFGIPGCLHDTSQETCFTEGDAHLCRNSVELEPVSL